MTAYGQGGDIPPPKGRREIPPQGREEIPPLRRNVDEIEASNLAVFKAAVGLLAERARSLSRISELNGRAERSVDAIRRRVFSDQLQSAGDYDESRSEISAFLKSCHRIFWPSRRSAA